MAPRDPSTVTKQPSSYQMPMNNARHHSLQSFSHWKFWIGNRRSFDQQNIISFGCFTYQWYSILLLLLLLLRWYLDTAKRDSSKQHNNPHLLRFTYVSRIDAIGVEGFGFFWLEPTGCLDGNQTAQKRPSQREAIKKNSTVLVCAGRNSAVDLLEPIAARGCLPDWK
jgi:hypothetical protein